jgi:PAS domain S-box-containing protein
VRVGPRAVRAERGYPLDMVETRPPSPPPGRGAPGFPPGRGSSPGPRTRPPERDHGPGAHDDGAPPWLLAALDGLPDGVVAFRAIRAEGTVVDFEYAYVNPAAARMVNRTVAELVGKRLLELFPGHVDTGLFDRYVRVVETGVPSTLEHLYDRDGLEAWYRSAAVPFGDGFTVAFQDITDRVEADTDLLEARARIETILASISDAFYALDRSWRFVYVNRAACEIIGRRPEDLLGLSIWDEFPDMVGSTFDVQFRRAVATGEAVRFEAHFSAPLDSWYEVRAYPGPDGISVYFRDVGEQRELAEHLARTQRLESIGSLAGGVAHDINNVLTVITGHAEALQAALAPGDPLRAEVDGVERAAERAATLTRQLLAFGRQQMLQPEPVDVATALRRLEPFLRRLIEADIEVDVDIDGTGLRVVVDPGQLDQVVLNLVGNARDAIVATGRTGGRITIRARHVAVDEQQAQERDVPVGPYVAVVVADDGVGMDDVTRARAVEPFFTTKAVGLGTGLGLSTVYGIVAQSGGTIALTSELGRGTTVTVLLPRQAPAIAEPGDDDDAGPATVLVVEDADGVRSLNVRVLERAGHHVLQAGDGEQGLAVAAAHDGPIELLVTDVVMPGIGGRELADRLLVDRPGMGVLFVSGYTEDTMLERGVRAACVDFLPKPFRPQELVERVAAALTRVRSAGRGKT